MCSIYFIIKLASQAWVNGRALHSCKSVVLMTSIIYHHNKCKYHAFMEPQLNLYVDLRDTVLVGTYVLNINFFHFCHTVCSVISSVIQPRPLLWELSGTWFAEMPKMS